MKRLSWFAYLAFIIPSAAAIIFAPMLGLGDHRDFILYQRIGLSRGLALQLLLWPGALAFLYEVLAIGAGVPAGRPRLSVVFESAWIDGRSIARGLFADVRAPVTQRELWMMAALATGFLIVFFVFLSKSLIWFKIPPEQHWWQAMLDFGLNWGAPIFSFGGNLLYSFGIQAALKGQLLPMEGVAHLFPIQHRIAATVTLYFIWTGALFWCIAAAIGLKPIYRVVFAGSVALLLSIPAGLNYVLWFLPPGFFTYQFTYAMWWGEAPILCLTTVVLFFLIGQQLSLLRNLCTAAGFAVGAFAIILAYPVGAIYFAPILGLYCLGLILTCRTRSEFWWKSVVSTLLAAAMLIARVPRFVTNLYSYTFGAYFFEFSPEPAASFDGNFLVIPTIHDPRGLFAFLIAFAALAMTAYAAKGALRRIAIAALVCEGGIITVTTTNLWLWQVPLPGVYAELAHAPVWGAFFVLAMIIVALLLDQRVAAWGHAAGPRCRRVVHHRRWMYGCFLIFTSAGYWMFQTPPATLSDYPPKHTPSVEFLIKELALTPGSQFRGRLMTVVPANLSGPATVDMFYEIVSNRYRRFLGNDYWIDPAASNIPTLNESHYFSTPPFFAIARIFFGSEGDGFGRTTIVLTRFDLRMARLVGARMVATNATAIPGGSLVYEAKAGDTELRIFRIDDVNVGQYSPVRARYAKNAADAIAIMRDKEFDPRLDVVVEGEIAADLVPATSSTVAVDRGPALVVRAASPRRSLLVLPFDYSRCLEMQATGGRAQLIPVNLQQTGLLFEGSIEARITYRFGIFRNSRCRGDDRKRADDLQIKEALVLNNRAILHHKRPALW